MTSIRVMHNKVPVPPRWLLLCSRSETDHLKRKNKPL